MTLALYGKSRRRRGVLGLLAALAVAMAVMAGSTLNNGGSASADPSDRLIPSGTGYDSDWVDSPSAGADFTNVDDNNSSSCSTSDTDFLYRNGTSGQSAFTLDISSVPVGATITTVEVKVCYGRFSNGGNNGTFRALARLDGTNSYGAGLVATSTGRQTATQTIDVADTVMSGTTDLEIGVQKTGGDDSYVGVYSINAVINYTPAGPPADLQVSKTDDTGGTAALGGSFNWLVTVTNTGPGDATFADGQTILADSLPWDDFFGTGVLTYGSPAVGPVSDVSGTGVISCAYSGGFTNALTCSASGGTVVIGAASGEFLVMIPVAVGSNYLDYFPANMTNPRPPFFDSPICSVDPNDDIVESNNGNNDCSASVTVTDAPPPAPDLVATKTHPAGPNPVAPATFDWTVHVTNQGNAAAVILETYPIVLDQLPAGVTVNSVSLQNASGASGITCYEDPDNTAGCYGDTGNATVNAGGSFDLVINVTIDSDGAYTNPESDIFCVVDNLLVVAESNENNNLCTPDTVTVDPPPPATILVQKQISGDGDPAQTFHLAVRQGHGPDATAIAGATVQSGDPPVGLGFAPGNYAVTEDSTPGWELTDISCTSDGTSTFSTFVPGTSYLNITAVSGDRIVCTFTNTAIRTVRIIKEVVGTDAAGVDFTGAIIDGAFPDPGPFSAFWLQSGPGTTDIPTPPELLLVVFEDPPGPAWGTPEYGAIPGPTLATDCSGVSNWGTSAPAISANSGDWTICVRNTYGAKITVEKLNNGGDPTDVFAIDVSNATNGVVDTFNLSNAEQDMGLLPPDTYNVVEQDPSGIGAGYLPGQAFWGPCSDYDAPVTPTALAAGDDVTVCVVNTPAAAPTWSKVGGAYENGAAHWAITIDNSSSNSIERTVTVMENDTLILDADCAFVSGGFECTVPAGETRTVGVARVVGQQCAETETLNSATAAVTSHTGRTLPDYNDVAAVIPGDSDLCDNPILTKTANPYTLGDDLATWVITVDNDVPDSGNRTVVITDPGVVLSAPSNDCVGGDIQTGLTCHVPIGGTLQLFVERAVQETCGGFNDPNNVSAVINLDSGGTEPLQNSPTGHVSVVVPPNTRFCDSTVTVTKQFDNNENGAIDGGDSFIGGWGMTLVCDGEVAEADTSGAGVVVFVVPGPGPGPDQDCTVTEDTVANAPNVGRELNGTFAAGTSASFSLGGNTDVTVAFLNDPAEEPELTGTLPGGPPPPNDPGDTTTPPDDTDVTETETPTEPPASITPPTNEVEAPTATVTPGTDSGVGSEGPDDGSDLADATPAAPDSGSGLAARHTQSATMLLFVAALLFVSGALGTFVIADKRK